MAIPGDDTMTASELEEEQRSDHWLAQEKEMIANFFEKLVPEKLAPIKETPAQSDCDAFAKRSLQTEDIQLVENQGSTSYTLICLSQMKIIQFRLKPFNEEILALAHQIYSDIVPSVTYIDGFPLPVYVSPVIPGQMHIFQNFPSVSFPLQRQLTTVVELAQFIAKSAFWPRPESSFSTTSWTKTAQFTLEKLKKNDGLKRFEPRFIEKATSLLEKLPLLDRLPPVLSHVDFAEINIMVNSQGNVTGVIDFEDAQTEAFGMCIFGIYEGFFGVMKHQKWSFFNQDAGDGSGKSVKNVLESAFWDKLWATLPTQMTKQKLEEAVMLALDIGIVNRYFVRGLLESVDLESQDHRISLEFARGLLLDR